MTFRAIDAYKAETYEELFPPFEEKKNTPRIKGPVRKTDLSHGSYRRAKGRLVVSYHEAGAEPDDHFVFDGEVGDFANYYTFPLTNTKTTCRQPRGIIYFQTTGYRRPPSIDQLTKWELDRLQWYVQNCGRIGNGLPPLERTPKGPRIPSWYVEFQKRQELNRQKFNAWKSQKLARLRKWYNSLIRRPGRDKKKRLVLKLISDVERKTFIKKEIQIRPYKWKYVNLITGEHLYSTIITDLPPLTPLPCFHAKVLENNSSIWTFGMSSWETSQSRGEAYGLELKARTYAWRPGDEVEPIELDSTPVEVIFDRDMNLFEMFGFARIVKAVNSHRPMARVKISLPLWLWEISDYQRTVAGFAQALLGSAKVIEAVSKDIFLLAKWIFHERHLLKFTARELSGLRSIMRVRYIRYYSNRVNNLGWSPEKAFDKHVWPGFVNLFNRAYRKRDRQIAREIVRSFKQCLQYEANTSLWYKFGVVLCIRDYATLVRNWSRDLKNREWYSRAERALKSRGKEKSFHTSWRETKLVESYLKPTDLVNLPGTVELQRQDGSHEVITIRPDTTLDILLRDIKQNNPNWDGFVAVSRDTQIITNTITSIMSYDWVDAAGFPLDEAEILRRWQLDTIGLNFDPKWIWDAISYSFCVDWAADVGNWLSAVTSKHRWTKASLRVNHVLLTRKVHHRVVYSILPRKFCNGIMRESEPGITSVSYQYAIDLDEEHREVTGEGGISFIGNDLILEYQTYNRQVCNKEQLESIVNELNEGHLHIIDPNTEPPVVKCPNWIQLLTGGELLVQLFVR